MKKGVAIVLAVAIIGFLGAYAGSGNHKYNTATLGATSNSTAGANTAVNYKDGTYSGQAQDSPYGTVQVAAIISGGKISDIKFLQMPNDRGHTQEVTAFSEPLLKQDALKKQNAHIDFVSGATTTSEAYEQSLQSALDKAVMG